MRVLVLGAAGSTGRLIVDQGISLGHEITALIRQENQSRSFSNQVGVVVGDALNEPTMEQAVTSQDAVIYALGSKASGSTTLFSESTRILLGAMEAHHVKRLVCITGVGSGETKGHGGFLYDRLIYPLFTRRIYEDKDRQETLIKNSHLDWVIVRPAAFREGKANRVLQTAIDLRGVTLRRIARHEVATFVLDQLTNDQYLRQTPFIGHR